MGVFTLKSDPDRPWLEPARDDQRSVLHDVWHEAGSVRSRWKPLRVRRVSGEDREVIGGIPTGPLTDFPTFDLPCFSRRAVNALREFLEPNGELLPLRCDEGEFFAYHITKQVAALDEQRSNVARIRTGRIAIIHRYEFLPEQLEGLTVFRLPTSQGGVTLVTNPFVELVRSSGLTGLELRQVWPSPQTDVRRASPTAAAPWASGPRFQMTERSLTSSERQQISEAAQEGAGMLGVQPDQGSPADVVEAIEGHLAGRQVRDVDDLAVSLGCLWGEQVRRGVSWEWVHLEGRANRESAGEGFALVPPDRSLAVLPMVWMRGQLERSRGERTVSLLFNMLMGGYRWDTPGPGSYHIIG